MTEAEWYESDDAGAMIEHLWQRQGISPRRIGVTFGGDMRQPSFTQGDTADLVRALHRFYLASCRGIWKLLPQEASRRGVELAEQFIAGRASADELNKFNWDVEGAAFRIDYHTDPEAIDRWVAEVRAIPEAELRSMLDPPSVATEIEPRELLKRAAYFVDYVMVYPSLGPMGPPPASCRPFLSAQVLRQHIGYPGHEVGSQRQGVALRDQGLAHLGRRQVGVPPGRLEFGIGVRMGLDDGADVGGQLRVLLFAALPATCGDVLQAAQAVLELVQPLLDRLAAPAEATLGLAGAAAAATSAWNRRRWYPVRRLAPERIKASYGATESSITVPSPR